MKARRPWAWPLVPLYAGGLAAKERWRRLRALALPHPRRLSWPVLSVGSLSAGGAGKTPLVISLARMLRSEGWAVDVLSRGYGRSGRGVEQVALPDAAEDGGVDGSAAARRFGDEPVLLAGRTGVPVWVGADRWAAGLAAETAVAPADAKTDANERGVHLLDDGFQHRDLHRDFDLVLVTAEDFDDVLLPAGNLREPLGALRRADAVAVREEEADELMPRLRTLLREGTPVWTIRRTLHFPAPLGVFGAGLRPLAFCAVARPDGFVRSLRRAGCGVLDAVIFPDHHRYGSSDASQIAAFAAGLNATGLVTTEKDAVKLSAGLRSRLEREVGPVMTVELRAEFVFKSPVLRALEPRLAARLAERTERAEGETRRAHAG